MRLKGSRTWLMGTLLKQNPEAALALENSAHIRGQLELHQAAALYVLAGKHNGGHILEIGTLAGYSASLMAQAAPEAKIVTLNPAENEIPVATANLARYQNIQIVMAKSWDYLTDYKGPKLDLIFVDGDHKRVGKDMPWWDWLAGGGLMLFHDYSPKACPPVYEAVNQLGERLGRGPDVLIMDEEKVGLAGFYHD